MRGSTSALLLIQTRSLVFYSVLRISKFPTPRGSEWWGGVLKSQRCAAFPGVVPYTFFLFFSQNISALPIFDSRNFFFRYFIAIGCTRDPFNFPQKFPFFFLFHLKTIPILRLEGPAFT